MTSPVQSDVFHTNPAVRMDGPSLPITQATSATMKVNNTIPREKPEKWLSRLVHQLKPRNTRRNTVGFRTTTTTTTTTHKKNLNMLGNGACTLKPVTSNKSRSQMKHTILIKTIKKIQSDIIVLSAVNTILYTCLLYTSPSPRDTW